MPNRLLFEVLFKSIFSVGFILLFMLCCVVVVAVVVRLIALIALYFSHSYEIRCEYDFGVSAWAGIYQYNRFKFAHRFNVLCMCKVIRRRLYVSLIPASFQQSIFLTLLRANVIGAYHIHTNSNCVYLCSVLRYLCIFCAHVSLFLSIYRQLCYSLSVIMCVCERALTLYSASLIV